MNDTSDFSLDGKRVLITGASSGIGRATALLCASMGAKLVLAGKTQHKLDELRSELSSSEHDYFCGDLTSNEVRVELVKSLPNLDGCVFSAGIAELVPIRMLTQSHIDRIMGINFYSPVLLTQSLLRSKKLNLNVSMVYLAAITDKSSPAATSIYSSSKNALLAFSRTLALEHAKQGLRSNCVSPGYVDTTMVSTLAANGLRGPELTPLGNIYPEEVAYGIAYLLAPASRWVTRSNLVIDGGLGLPMRL